MEKGETDGRDSFVEDVVKWIHRLLAGVVELENEAKDFIGEVEEGGRGRR